MRWNVIFSDGRSVDRRVHPWQLSGLVRGYFPRLQGEHQPLAVPQHLLSVVLAWWIVPATLAFCWFRCLRRQDWWLTGFQLSCLLLSIALGGIFQALAVDTFRGKLPRKGSWVKDKFRGLFSGSGFLRRALEPIRRALDSIAAKLSRATQAQQPSSTLHLPQSHERDEQILATQAQQSSSELQPLLYLIAAVLGLATLLVFSIAAVDGRVPWCRASFEGAEVSTTPPNWISPATIL